VDSYTNKLPSGNAELKMLGTSLALYSDLTYNVLFHKDIIKSGNYTNFRVEVSMYDKKFDTWTNLTFDSSNYAKQGNYLICKVTGISPRKMNDTINIKIYGTYEGVEYCTEVTSTIGGYCYKNFELYPDDAKLMTAIADLLNFGAAHQVYTGYDAKNLVNAAMTEQQKGYATTSELSLVNYGNSKHVVLEGATATWIGATVVLTEKIALQFIFDVEDTTGMTAKVVCGGKTTTIKEEQIEQYATSKYECITFTGLQAKQLRDLVYVTLYRNGVAISNTYQFSVESYAYSYIDNTTIKNLAATVKAMMYFGDSAKAYFDK
jgi:hypothetical protein